MQNAGIVVSSAVGKRCFGVILRMRPISPGGVFGVVEFVPTQHKKSMDLHARRPQYQKVLEKKNNNQRSPESFLNL